MSLESYSYRGIKTLDNIEGTDGNGILLGSSVSLDFKNTRVAIGHLGNATSQGKVTVHSLVNATSNEWTTSQTITEPSASNGSFFGYAVSMNWNGTRIAVGAPKKSNGTVYVFDATSSGSNPWATYVSNTITSSSTSSYGNFGFSISLGQDIDTTLAIGNPNDNRVEIWKLSNHSWSQAYSNVGDDIDNNVPYDSAHTQFTTINNSIGNIKSLQYGFSVKLAAFGTHVIIGAPGSVLNEINSSNSNNTGTQRNNIIVSASPTYAYSGVAENLPFAYRQPGYARILTTIDDWSTTSGVSQLGQTLSGLDYTTSSNYVNGGGLHFPTLGFSVSMNFDGSVIAMGAPSYDQAYVYEYSIVTSLWVQRGSTVIANVGNLNGLCVRLDYTGNRLATSMISHWAFPAKYSGQLYVVDWSGASWVEAQLPISGKDPGVGYEHSYGAKQFSGYTIDMTDGNQVASSQLWWGDDDMVNDNFGTGNSLSSYLGSYPSNQNAKGRVQFYFFLITGTFTGNNIFEGYVTASELRIGANDNAIDNQKPKRLSFGGTSGDNFYDETLIENRVIAHDVAELLLHKHHDTNEQVDRIRLKASEIHLDHMRMYHSVYQDGREGKDIRTPRFILDQFGTIAIGNLWSGHESSSTTTSLAETYLDIKAETQIRDKLNVNYPGRTKLLKSRDYTHEGYLPAVINTRCADLIDGNKMYDDQPGEVKEYSITNHGNMPYIESEKAFEFTNTNSGIGYSSLPGNWTDDDASMMFWLKLKDDHSNYTSSNVLCSWGDTLSSTAGVYTGGCLQLTSTGLTLNFGSGIGTASNTYTFTRDTWYHICVVFPTETTSTVIDSSNVDYIFINNQNMNLTKTYSSPTFPKPEWDSQGWRFGYGEASGSIPGPAGTFMGMMIFNMSWGHGGSLIKDYSYNNGSPSECLSVGGDAFIQNKLSIGSNVSPSKTLEVTGNVNVISGNIYQNNNLLWPATSSGVDIYQTSNVGIGTSTPGVPLDISYSSSSSTNGIQLTQGSTSQNSIIQVKVASGGTGDPLLSLSCEDGSGSAWCVGIDNSQSDKFVIANDDNDLSSSQYITCGGNEIDLKKRILINGNSGTDGQVLTSGGSSGSVAWEDASGGGGSSPWTTSGSAAGTYPPSAMISNSSGGYGSSASSTNYSPTFEVFKAFNQTISDEGWHGTAGQYSSTTRNYTGSFSTTYDGSSTVSGEWIQLQFPSSTSIAEIEIAPRSGSNNYLNRCASDGIILGSTNGSTWTSIATFSGKTYTTGNYTSITFAASSSYTYFRVVITKLSGSSGETVINISELRFKGGGNSIYYPSSGSSSVGIGTTSPSYTLDVDGDINMSTGSSFRINGVAQSFGVSSPWTTSGSNIYRSSGNVGIGTSSPEAYLHVRREGSSGESNVYIQSYSDAPGDQAALFLGTPHVSDSTSQPKCAIIADTVGYSRADLHFCVETTQNNGSAYRASTSNSRMMIDGLNGNIGMGTTTPGAFLDVNGSSSQGSFSSGNGRYFNSGTGSHVTSYSGSAQWAWSIRASNSIGCGNSIICHNGTWNSSDSRIKTNINDVTDASALEKINLLKPKTYKYIDTNEQGDTTVYGFIAQEVSNVFPEAVKISVKAVPNIYELSNVSESNVITFTNFNTSDLLTSNVTSKIEVKSVYGKIENLTLDTVIDSKSIRVKEDLTNIIGSIDDTGNIVSGNQVFVMGQEVDNFNIVKKEYIFTIATAALQEVDRQLQAEKTKVVTLETQVADLLARVTALENA